MKRGALGLEIWAGQFLELDGAANSVVGRTCICPPLAMPRSPPSCEAWLDFRGQHFAGPFLVGAHIDGLGREKQ